MADVFNGVTGGGGSFNETEGDARYVNETDFTKAVIDAMGIDAATVGGLAASAFALASALATKADLVSGKVPVSQLPDTVVGALDYQGTWNASTNSPNLSGLSPTKGDYYKVSTAGGTSLSGITDWGIGDWAVYNGSAWDKVDNSEVAAAVVQATESVLGGGYVATTTQATSGSNDATIMTPLKTRQAGDARYPLTTATNPYPQYLTAAEGNDLYEPLGGGGGGAGGGSVSFASLSKYDSA